MIVFWSISALLVAVALLFLLPPLLRRPDTSAPRAGPNHARSRHARRDARSQQAAPQAVPEHARSGRIAAIVVGLGIPLACVLLYLQLGNPQGLTSGQAETQTARQTAAEQMETRMASLVGYLERNPKDLKAWAMLARSQGAMGR